VAPDPRRIDHVLPIVGEADFDQRFRERIPHSVFGPTAEANVNGIPFAITFVHIAPGATHAQDVEHAIQKAPVVLLPRQSGSDGSSLDDPSRISR
jgi:hypothetical protein